MKNKKLVHTAFFMFSAIAFIMLCSFSSVEGKKDKTPGDPTTDYVSILNGKFLYKGTDENTVHLIITQFSHTEYYNAGQYKVVSNLKWLSNDEFGLEVTEVTLPESDITVGTQMKIKITKLLDDKIFYTCTLNNTSWKGCIEKVRTE